MANNTNNLPYPSVLLTDAGGGMSQPWYLYFTQQGLLTGTGAPINAAPGASGLGADGNYYFRKDGTVGNHIYFRSGGVWTALV